MNSQIVEDDEGKLHVTQRRGPKTLTSKILTAMANFVHDDGTVGYEPEVILMRLSLYAKSEKVKAEAAGMLLARKYPVLKSVDMSTSDGSSFVLTIMHPGSEEKITNSTIKSDEK